MFVDRQRRYQDYILDIDTDIAQLWGRVRVPYYENALAI